jgi:hypothetical protein
MRSLIFFVKLLQNLFTLHILPYIDLKPLNILREIIEDCIAYFCQLLRGALYILCQLFGLFQ